MREEISGLDLIALERELKVLEGGRLDKIYQRGRELIVHFYVPGDKKYRLFLSSGKVFLSKYKRDVPEKPPNFCMFLRKYLSGKNVQKIRQKGFDRILEIHTEKYTLICELFGDGNFILVNKDMEILAALESREWKNRSIYKGEKYQYPEPALNPESLDPKSLSKIKKINKEIVRVLASEIGLGGTYAEEVLFRSSIEKDKNCQNLEEDELKEILDKIRGVISILKSGDLEPLVYYKNGEPQAVAPFRLKKYWNLEEEKYQSFSKAVDEFFTKREKAKVRKREEEKFQEKLGKLERMKEEQEEKLKGLKRAVEENKEKADMIYRNYSLIENLIDTLKKAQKKFDNDKILKKLEEEKDKGVPEAEAIEDLKINEQQVVIDIGKNIVIDFDMNVEKNAEKYYEKSKKSKKKIEGAEKSLKETKEKIKELKENKEDIDISKKFKDKEKAKKEKKWYEKFRWFFSSDNFLIIGGRGATTNDIIVKKYAEDKDVLFHADTRGAPFFVIKTQGEGSEEVPEGTIKEAAQASASYSSAWKKGLGNMDVYWIKPEQAVKVPGLPKGAFQIQGERTYLRNTEISAAVGAFKRENNLIAMGGPLSAVKSRCPHYVVLKNGKEKKSNVAKEVKDSLENSTQGKFDLDSIVRALPPDQCEIKEKH